MDQNTPSKAVQEGYDDEGDNVPGDCQKSQKFPKKYKKKKVVWRWVIGM